MNRIRLGQFLNSRCALPLAALSLLLAAVGCGGGGQSIIAISPATAQVLDAGQSLTVSASVVNDSQAYGATFALSGPGTLGQETITRVGDSSIVSLTYTAPATVAAQTTVTITATSQNTPSQTAKLTITLNPALVINTATLPNGQVGVAYSAPVSTTGGAGSIAWSVSSGSLPPGLSISPTTGTVSGNPTTFGTYTFTVSAQDATTTKVPTTATYTVTIAAPTPKITTTSLPNGLAGATYSQQLTYTGGNGSTPVFSYTGNLPSGLTLSSTGLISGSPSVASSGTTYNFTVSLTVGTQSATQVSLSITVPPYPTVTTTSLPNGNIGIAYSKQLNYNGGNGGTVSWAITPSTALSGSGLSFNTTTGLISGNPTTATTYSFSVAVTVGTQTSTAQSLTLTVYALDITSATTATGEINLPFGFQLTAAGGTAPYTWQVLNSGNSLPAGLSLNSSTGVISGTPTTQGTVTGVNIQATDSAAPANTATVSMTFTINAARSSANNSELNGPYVFLLSGFDSVGYPVAAIGQFTASAGAITSGTIDINGTLASDKLSNQALSASTYSVGPDNRGVLTLKYATNTLTFTLVADSIVSGTANGGYLDYYNSNGTTLTGTFAAQTSGLNASSFSGNYAFGLQGFGVNATPAALTHRAEAGVIGLGAVITPPEYVQSSSNSGSPLTAPSLTFGPCCSNGRSALYYGQPSGASGAPQANFVVYGVSPTKLYIMSTDNAYGAVGTTGVNDLLYGTMLQQTTGTFSSTSLTGTSVVRTQSLPSNTTTGVPYTDARVGLYTFNGTTVQLNGDENAGGAPKTLAQTATYTVNTNGRVQVNFPSGGLSGCTNCTGGGNTYFYLVGPNQGFIVDLTPAATAGYFEPQTATSFSGSYSVGTVNPLSQSATYLTGELVSNGSGTLTGTADESSAGTLTPDLTLAGTYIVAASGRGTLTTPGSGNSVLYVVSPTKAVVLDLGVTSPVIEEVVQ